MLSGLWPPWTCLAARSSGAGVLLLPPIHLCSTCAGTLSGADGRIPGCAYVQTPELDGAGIG